MKINEIFGPLQVNKKVQAGKSGEHNDFSRILDETKKQIETPSTQPPAFSGIDPLTDFGMPPMASDATKVLERASHLLDIMDHFAQALGDPGKSLKSMEPMVRQMEKELKVLEASSGNQDKVLASLANEIAVLAQIETVKFDRGDYL
jgi:hypothetical protein